MLLEVNRMYRQFISAVCVLLNIQVHRPGRNTHSMSNGIIILPMLFRTAINIKDVANSVKRCTPSNYYNILRSNKGLNLKFINFVSLYFFNTKIFAVQYNVHTCTI